MSRFGKKKAFSIYFLLTLFIISACTVVDSHYYPGYYLGQSKHKNNRKETGLKKEFPENEKRRIVREENIRIIDIKPENDEINQGYIASADNMGPVIIHGRSPKFNINQHKNNNNLLRVIINHMPPDSCDNIVLKSGDEISAVVEEVSETSIRYRRCDNKSGPSYSISKNNVFMVKYFNGTKDVFNLHKEVKPESKKDTLDTSHAKTEWLGVAGFLVALLSIPVWLWLTMIVGFVAGIVAIIFGGTSINRIGSRPDKYKGMGLAILSVIIGLLLIILTIIILAKIKIL